MDSQPVTMATDVEMTAEAEAEESDEPMETSVVEPPAAMEMSVMETQSGEEGELTEVRTPVYTLFIAAATLTLTHTLAHLS